jgi:hypothetical protein
MRVSPALNEMKLDFHLARARWNPGFIPFCGSGACGLRCWWYQRDLSPIYGPVELTATIKLSGIASRGGDDRFDARLYGVAGQFGAVAGTGLVPDPVQVRPHCVRRDKERLRDLGVARSAGQ